MFKNLAKSIKSQQISLKNWKEETFNKEKESGCFDYVLLTVVVLLIVLGILTLASASAPISQQKFGIPYFFLRQQLLWLVIGTILAFLAFKIRLNFLKKWVPILLFINLVALAMVFVPDIGIEVWGATRWVEIGPISFQPAEFLKINFILYLAVWFSARLQEKPSEFSVSQSKKREKEKFKKNHNSFHIFWRTTSQMIMSGKHSSKLFIPFLIVISLISLLLILQPDISTLAVILLTAVLMYFAAGFPLRHSFLMFFMGIAGLFALVKIAPYRIDRLLVFLNPEIDPLGVGFHIKQALIAIGSGGIFGAGLGMSIQRFGFLPQPISDSIFAVFAEENGFIGAIVLIFLFLIFVWRGLKIAKKTENKFFQLTAIGITAWIIIQAFVNIGSMTGLLPLTGIPLPFISYGGSSLIVTLIATGILLNISKQK